MRAKKEKRNFWLSSEVDCMLRLIKEIQAAQGTTSTTHYTFVQIANKMRAFGFPNKSPTQIRRKWFQMKSAYLCYRRGNKDRLLLIPEKFRKDIAQFVEGEYKSCKPENVEVESDLPHIYQKNCSENIQPENKMKVIEQKALGREKTARTCNDDNSYDYQFKFFKLTTRLKGLHKSLCDDFTRSQKSLMDYEHTLQRERDALILQSFKKISNMFQIH